MQALCNCCRPTVNCLRLGRLAPHSHYPDRWTKAHPYWDRYVGVRPCVLIVRLIPSIWLHPGLLATPACNEMRLTYLMHRACPKDPLASLLGRMLSVFDQVDGTAVLKNSAWLRTALTAAIYLSLSRRELTDESLRSDAKRSKWRAAK